MPRVPSLSPATGRPTHDHFIHTIDANFVDNDGRTLLLRGVNLSGSSKAPVGRPSYVLHDFWENSEAGGESFIGRPLNIDDGSADVHLARLKAWGFNLLRFPVTWEAIEHAGPGKYDDDFIQYTIRVLQKCKQFGFRVYMDPHQDTWSRFSGGSGAPYWTLPACGINPRNITATQAAVIHCEYPLANEPDPASLPAMIWSTNYGRLLSQTLFTLFFAGRTFAPNCIIDGQNIQDYLQSHFIEAMGRMADHIRAFDGGSLLDDCVIGWDSLNEPFEGLCGWQDLSVNPVKQGSTLKKGTHPTPMQSLRLGMGQLQTVENWTFGVFGPSRDGSVTIDPKGRKLWADPVPEIEGLGERPDGYHPRWGWKRDVARWALGTCIWAQHGVWDVETGYLLQPDYFFFNSNGEECEFISDYWKPHFLSFSHRIRRAHPEAIIFVQPPVFAPPPAMTEDELKGRCAYSGHYYDGLTLVTRHWNWFNADALGLLRGKYTSPLQAVKIGETAIRRSLQEQLCILKSDAKLLGAYPTVIGEIGTPFDMDGKRSYGWTDGGKYKGDYSNQEKALDASLNGCDGANGLSYTIWTYCPDHTHDWSDGWNMEDLSLWSPDDLRAKEEAMRAGEDMESLFEGSKAQLLAERSALPLRRGLFGRRGTGMGKLVRLEREQPQRSLAMRAAASCLNLASLVSLPLHTSPRHSIPLAAAASSASTYPPGHSLPALSIKSSASFSAGRLVATPSRTSLLSTSSAYSLKTRSHWNQDLEGLAGWCANPYDFLTDGARAVRAFCRPCPVKVIGRLKNVKFDIGKAFFKMVVEVRSEDRVRRMDGLEELATEVYVPLVHYAHSRLIGPEEDEELRLEKTRRGLSREGPVESSTSEETLEMSANASDVRMTNTINGNTGNEEHTHAHLSSAVQCGDGLGHGAHAALGEDELLDVEVRVSTGRWAVRGQKMWWWYDAPGDGEGSRECWIEVTRRDGVIKPGNVRRRGMRGGVGLEAPQTCCETLCESEGGCIVT